MGATKEQLAQIEAESDERWRAESMQTLRQALQRPFVQRLLSQREVATVSSTAEAGVYAEAVRFYSRLSYRVARDS